VHIYGGVMKGGDNHRGSSDLNLRIKTNLVEGPRPSTSGARGEEIARAQSIKEQRSRCVGHGIHCTSTLTLRGGTKAVSVKLQSHGRDISRVFSLLTYSFPSLSLSSHLLPASLSLHQITTRHELSYSSDDRSIFHTPYRPVLGSR